MTEEKKQLIVQTHDAAVTTLEKTLELKKQCSPLTERSIKKVCEQLHVCLLGFVVALEKMCGDDTAFQKHVEDKYSKALQTVFEEGFAE